MLELLVVLFGAALGWCVAYLALRPLEEVPELAKYVLASVSAIGGGLLGFLLVWLGKSTASGPTKEQQQRYKPQPTQVVGQSCAACSERIMFVGDAHICNECGKVYCLKCETKLPCSNCSA